jgi:hypothetical protein
MFLWQWIWGRMDPAHVLLKYSPMNDPTDPLTNLNNNQNLDFKSSAAFLFENDDLPNPYLDINIDSKFFDNDAFIQSYSN